MDSVKFSLFDVFGYALPGFLTICGIIVLCDTSVIGVDNLIAIATDINFSKGLLIALISFVLGFALDTPGSLLYYEVGCKVFEYYKKEVNEQYAINREQEKNILVLVREKCPENTEMLKTWKLYKTMSHNLSFSLLVLSAIFLIKVIFFKVASITEWYLLSSASFILSFIFLYRASVFDRWYYTEIVHTALSLNLIDLKRKTKK